MSQSTQKNKSWLNEWEDDRDILLSSLLSQDEPADKQTPQDQKETTHAKA
jgi:hypothetical protein